MAAFKAPGKSPRLSHSSAARVAASISRHTERIQRANIQRLPANLPRRPASGSPAQNPSVVIPPPRTRTGPSRIPYPPAGLPVIRLRCQDLATSRIPLPIVRRTRAPGVAHQLTSCLRNPAKTVRRSKTVHWESEHSSVAQVRRYVPNDPYPFHPEAEYPENCCPTIPGLRQLIRRSDGSVYLAKQNGLFPSATKPGSKGPDGQKGRCPYCSLNAAFGRFLPAFFDDDDDDEDYDLDAIGYAYYQENEMVKCEDHQSWN